MEFNSGFKGLTIVAASQYALIYCAILRPWRKVPWTAPPITPSSCHNSCSSIILHTSLLLSAHNIHMNLIAIKRMVTSVIDKHFGLIDTGQRWLGGNKTPSPASIVLLCLGLMAATAFLHRLTLRKLMLYIYMEHLFLMFLDHTQRRNTVGRISAGERPQAVHLLRSWVRIPPGARIFVCCECRVLSGTGFCDELITRPEESYRLWCVVVCDLETSRIGAPCIYDISCLRVNDLTLILLTWRKW